MLAACCVAGGLAQLATAALVPPGAAAYPGPLTRVGLQGLDWLRRLPWAEGVVLGALVLEALHPARPWHTAVLGVALVAYLLATHLAESAGGRGEAAAVLRGQAPVLAAGLGLLVLAAASALLPPAGTGLAGSWLRAAAAVAAVLACRPGPARLTPLRGLGTPLAGNSAVHRVRYSAHDAPRLPGRRPARSAAGGVPLHAAGVRGRVEHAADPGRPR